MTILGPDVASPVNEGLLSRQLPSVVLLDPRVKVSCWLDLTCEVCESHLAIVPTTDNLLDADNFEIVCTSCGLTVPSESLFHTAFDTAIEILDQVPERTIGPEKYGRGREDSLVFGKNLGTQKNVQRAKQLGYVVRTATGIKSGLGFVKPYYELKNQVGVNEDNKSIKSALEMGSRKIRKVESIRHIDIPEPYSQRIGNLVRKGIRKAERYGKTSTRERKMIVEQILRTENLWPP
jgi:hypothetical protein